MSDVARTIAPFLAFAALLRRSGFAVAPEQIMAWLAAIEILGPSRNRRYPSLRPRDTGAAAGALCRVRRAV